MAEEKYDSSAIRTLEWNKHIRQRSGMYIGRLGNGDNPEDGIYILLKEVVDNSIDEFGMGYGKQIQITVEDGSVTVRDFGRGIPLDKVIDATSKLNTGGKFDDKNFKKSVGMNGVGTKAVNALSSYFYVDPSGTVKVPGPSSSAAKSWIPAGKKRQERKTEPS